MFIVKGLTAVSVLHTKVNGLFRFKYSNHVTMGCLVFSFKL